jgi:hypothetical protein
MGAVPAIAFPPNATPGLAAGGGGGGGVTGGGVVVGLPVLQPVRDPKRQTVNTEAKAKETLRKDNLTGAQDTKRRWGLLLTIRLRKTVKIDGG